MSYFDDFIAAVEAYPQEYLTIEIVDVDYPGGGLNAGERATFEIQITNSGPLHVTDVTFKVTGLHGAQVIDNFTGAVAEDHFTTRNALESVPAHHPNTPVKSTNSVHFGLVAPGSQQPERTLVKVTLEDWNCNLLHALEDHSDPDVSVKADWSAEVFPR